MTAVQKAPFCVFCEIANRDQHGQIEAVIRDHVIIAPLNPVTPGHKLVIPRRHVRDAAQDPHATAQAMRAAAIYLHRYPVGDCNVITSIGAAATQTVFHLHVHIVPRNEGDGLPLPWTER